ncbi:class III signal peptide-containing protein [Candidatus Micrarchaeota archaeon]|nr:class III signal peptide-containing protein [Candidatus Micrarchaeota archaeon]
MKGQISAEMLVLAAAVIAIAFLLITQLESTAVQSANILSNKTDSILGAIEAIS